MAQAEELMAARAQLDEVLQANASITEQLVAKQQALEEALAANRALKDALTASKSAAAQVSCPSGVSFSCGGADLLVFPTGLQPRHAYV